MVFCQGFQQTFCLVIADLPHGPCRHSLYPIIFGFSECPLKIRQIAFIPAVALSTLVKVKLQPKQKIGLSAISSAGSGENVKLLRENKVQFAILQGLYGAYAWKGTGPIKNEGPQKNLRSVTMLWQNVEHFTVNKKFAKTGTVSDLLGMKGETLSLGKKNSGTLGSNTVLLTNLGADVEHDYKLIYVGYGPSANALQNHQAAGMSTPAGSAIYLIASEDAIYARGVRMVPAEWIAGIILILCALEFTRRVAGWFIPVLILVALSYVGWWGGEISGMFKFAGLRPETILFRSIYGDDALFGTIAGISSSYVFMFILFGAFLLRSGAGEFVIDLARAVAGKMVGGPGLVAGIPQGIIRDRNFL